MYPGNQQNSLVHSPVTFTAPGNVPIIVCVSWINPSEWKTMKNSNQAITLMNSKQNKREYATLHTRITKICSNSFLRHRKQTIEFGYLSFALLTYDILFLLNKIWYDTDVFLITNICIIYTVPVEFGKPTIYVRAHCLWEMLYVGILYLE